MSPIEKLKAEAAALREREKAAGRDLKHCDALEIVAKKHGYANWRACRAILGKPGLSDNPATAAKSPPSAEARLPLRGSRLLEGDFVAVRQAALTRWLGPGLRQAAVDFSRNLGLLPIYAETSEQGTRYLFWNLPPGAGCEVRSGRPKERFLDFDRRNREQGRKLLSLHISAQELYSAVWVCDAHCAPAVRFLEKFGVGKLE